jgi:hypothetical protein
MTKTEWLRILPERGARPERYLAGAAISLGRLVGCPPPTG